MYKKLIALLLALTLVIPVFSIAEEQTAEEMGEQIFHDLARTYDIGLNYLKHRQALWSSFIETSNMSFPADIKWFYLNHIMLGSTNMGLPISLFYYMNFLLPKGKQPNKEKLYDEIYENLFMPLYRANGEYYDGFRSTCLELVHLVFYGSETERSEALQEQKAKIKALLEKYPDYEYGSSLKTFYKECLQLQDYISSSSDNYNQANDQISTFEQCKRELRSEFDFDFEWKDLNDDYYAPLDDISKLILSNYQSKYKKYLSVGSGFFNGLAPVQDEDKKWGFINTHGTIVIDCEYDAVTDFYTGYSVVAIKEAADDSKGTKATKKTGVIDTSGRFVIPMGEYQIENAFYDGLCAVCKNGKWGYVDENDHIVIDLIYDGASYFSEGLAPVQVDGKYGAIDKNGNMVIEPQFDGNFYFHEGIAQAPVLHPKQDEKDKGYHYIYIDKTGNQIIPGEWSFVSVFSEGISYRTADDIHYEFIDASGNVLFELGDKYKKPLSAFQEGMIIVDGKEGGLGVMDASGKEIVPPQYKSMSYVRKGMHDGYIAVKDMNSGLWGVIDRNNKTVIPVDHDRIYSFNEGYCIGIKENNICIYNENGINIMK